MKMKLVISLALIFFLNSFNLVQSQSLEQEQFYRGLKKLVASTAMSNPFDSTGRKYISFSYEILIGKEVKVQLSENAPWGAKNRTERLRTNILTYLEDQKFVTENDLTIVYPIFFQFDHISEQSNSMGFAIESLIDFSDQKKCPRIERPIYVISKKPIVN